MPRVSTKPLRILQHAPHGLSRVGATYMPGVAFGEVYVDPEIESPHHLIVPDPTNALKLQPFSIFNSSGQNGVATSNRVNWSHRVISCQSGDQPEQQAGIGSICYSES